MGVAERGSVALAHVTDAHVAPYGKKNAALKNRSVDIFRDLVDQIAQRGVDLTLFGGDNIDNNGHGEEDLEAFAAIAERVGPHVCIVGNHEAEAPLPGQISKDRFALRMAGHGITPERLCFSQAAGNVRVIGIDTTLVGTSGG